MTSKDLIEIIAVIVGVGSAAAAGGFAVATSRSEARIDRILGELDDWHTFAQKVKQNINHNLVEIGLLKTDVRDIKRVLEMRRAQSFPEENKPPHTDFN
ncbi:hypothetical protein [Microcoleus sp. B7-D4]|uniref:hypothetical protein n=1 Tax=Microcoleus sp. B7-D4 TaxID=2818696 RepID=UPI002FCEB125